MTPVLKSLLPPSLLALTMGVIFVLPKKGEIQESAIRMELPRQLGTWFFHPISPSENEVRFLAKDTQFSKAICFTPRPDAEPDFMGRLSIEQTYQADLSIVLSGYDLNSSIHRPERCMPAQGHKILETTASTIDLTNGRKLPVQRLVSSQEIPSENPLQRGQTQSLTYYFFVGSSDVVASHEKRTLIDMRDRVFKGEDQRWAYVTVSVRFGEYPGKPTGTLMTLEEADQSIRHFLADLAENNIDWSKVENSPQAGPVENATASAN